VSVDELAAALAELRDRVAALEERPPPAARGVAAAELASALGATESGVVAYAGVGPRAEGEIAWQMARSWPDVLAADRSRSTRALAALGSRARLDLLAELLAGPVGRQELLERVDQSSAGQLSHHLRELLAAGLVEQPRRGVYQVPIHRVVPLLTLLCCAIDLAVDVEE
jgi:DNA-binding transcriptional ArsR family regulator